MGSARVGVPHRPLLPGLPTCGYRGYRGTSPIRNRLPLGPYSRDMPKPLQEARASAANPGCCPVVERTQGYLAHKKHPPLPGPPCRGQTNRTETSPRPHLTGVPRTPRKGNLLILLAHKNTHPSKTLPQAFDEGRTSVRVEQQRVRVEQHLATRTHPRAGIRVEHAGQISAHPQGGTHPSRTLPQGCV